MRLVGMPAAGGQWRSARAGQRQQRHGGGRHGQEARKPGSQGSQDAKATGPCHRRRLAARPCGRGPDGAGHWNRLARPTAMGCWDASWRRACLLSACQPACEVRKHGHMSLRCWLLAAGCWLATTVYDGWMDGGGHGWQRPSTKAWPGAGGA